MRETLERILTRPADPAQLDLVARSLQPFGADVIERLANHGLRLELGQDGFPHYDTNTKTLVLDRDTLSRQTDPPLRSYAILHEFAHALDFLWEAEGPPLSQRPELGIDAHRRRMGQAYDGLLQDYNRRKQQLEREGKWLPQTPPFPVARVYYEDYVTGVERVAGRQLAERPARGHLDTLSPDKHPTEYFADTLYCYLHQDALKTYRYTLPDGQMIDHPFPPNRELLQRRDPRMHACVEHFFRAKEWRPVQAYTPAL